MDDRMVQIRQRVDDDNAWRVVGLRDDMRHLINEIDRQREWNIKLAQGNINLGQKNGVLWERLDKLRNVLLMIISPEYKSETAYMLRRRVAAALQADDEIEKLHEDADKNQSDSKGVKNEGQ